MPLDRWTKLRNEFVEWPALLSVKYPQPRSIDERIVRLPEGVVIQGLEPPIAAGSLLLLDEASGIATLPTDATTGWGRNLFAIRRGGDFLCGYLERDSDRYVLFAGATGTRAPVPLHQDELRHLNRVSGVAVPV